VAISSIKTFGTSVKKYSATKKANSTTTAGCQSRFTIRNIIQLPLIGSVRNGVEGLIDQFVVPAGTILPSNIMGHSQPAHWSFADLVGRTSVEIMKNNPQPLARAGVADLVCVAALVCALAGAGNLLLLLRITYDGGGWSQVPFWLSISVGPLSIILGFLARRRATSLLYRHFATAGILLGLVPTAIITAVNFWLFLTFGSDAHCEDSFFGCPAQ
jgi:hypothetical protein